MNRHQTIITIILYLIFFALVGVLSFFIVYNADWLLGDQHQFLSTTALGECFSTLPLSSQINRFWPLGLVEYNLSLLFTPSATVHYAINIPIYVILCISMLALCYHSIPKGVKYDVWTHVVILLGTALVVSRLYSIFLELIYPEKMLCMMLTLFLLCGIKFFQTDKWGYGVVSLLAAVYATYCKEVVFGALLVFTLVFLIFGYKTLSRAQKVYLYLLIVNSIVFISIYLLCVYSPKTGSYHIQNPYSSKIELILAMLRSQKMIAVAWLFALVRVYALLFKKEKEHLFFDAMLFTGCAYFCEMIIMDGCTNYFYMPSIVCVVPSMVYFSLLYLRKWGTILIIGSLSLFYMAKVPQSIKDSQVARQRNPYLFHELVNYHHDGYALLWYVSPKNTYLRDYHRQIYVAYLQYLLGREFDVVDVASLEEYKEENYVLLYYGANAPTAITDMDSIICTYSLQSILQEEASIPILKHDVE